MDSRAPIRFTNSKIIYVLTTPEYSSIVEKELTPEEWGAVAEFIDWVGSTPHGVFEATAATGKDKYGKEYRIVDRVIHMRRRHQNLPLVY